MAKRRCEASDGSDYEDHAEHNDSDASFIEETRSKPQAKARAKGSNKRKKTLPSESEALAVDTSSNQHSRKIHTVQNTNEVRKALLLWYDTVRDTRGMPWRKPFDATFGRAERSQRAYEVWVSEIMLQQTQVATVIPYYNRWMAKFPTISTLANASVDEVNSLWKGLGYYSRASRLLAGAQKVVQELGGLLPDNAKDMETKIPGIGRYSAGAICSIAYGEKAPVLDGNVHRLLSRFLMLHANPKSKATLDILWAAAEAMVDVKGSYQDPNYQNPGDINQALIELGSTVCRVQNPACAACPLKDQCGAYQKATGPQSSEGVEDIEDLCVVCEPIPSAFDVTLLPMKAEKKKAREETDIVNVVEWRETPNSQDRWFLLVKRPEKGLLAGLYEFPTQSNVSDSDSKECLTTGLGDLLSSLLVSPIPISGPSSKSKMITIHREDNGDSDPRLSQVMSLGDVLHLFSHVKKTYRAQWVVLEGGGSTPPAPAIKNRMETAGPRKKNANTKQKARATPVRTPSLEDVRWVRTEDIDQENLSTGMVKVWNLAKSNW